MAAVAPLTVNGGGGGSMVSGPRLKSVASVRGNLAEPPLQAPGIRK